MKTKKALALAIVAAFILASTPGHADDSAEANRLFIAVVKALRDAEAISGNGLASAESRFRLFSDATISLHRIIDNHSGADLAVKLMIGEDIGPVSIERIQKSWMTSITQLANALSYCDNIEICLKDQALREAQIIEEPSVRAGELARVAIAELSPRLFMETLKAIDGSFGGLTRDNFIRYFAHAQFEDGDLPGAKHTAEEIKDPRLRGVFYNNLVRAQAKAGQFSAAMEIAQRPIDKIYDDRVRMFEDISVAQAISGRPSDALLTVSEIKDDWSRARALGAVSIAQAETGFYSDAIANLIEIKIPNHLVKALSKIAVLNEEYSYFAVALEYAGQIVDERDRGWAYQNISEAQAEAGKFVEAAETLDGVGWEGGRSSGFNIIAVAQAKAGQYSDGLKTANKINTPGMADDAITQIAVSQAEAGLFSDAMETVQKIIEPRSVNNALAQLSGSYAESGQFSDAFDIASRINDSRYHSHALGRIALVYAKAGKFEKAIEIIRKVVDQETQGRAMGQVAIIQAETGLLAEAIHTALEQPDARFRVETLIAIADKIPK